MLKEEELMIQQAEAQIAAANSGAVLQNNQATAHAQMIQDQEQSMVAEQLDLSDELCRIEHLLRGHILKRQADGSSDWDETIDNSCPPPLNEYGVRVIMKVISFYLNKNKLLSNYDLETINEKMEDFSIELADLIFMKYREMGLDSAEKRKMYSVIVRELQDTVHDTYLRCLSGKERDSIRKHWNITENMGSPNNLNNSGGMNPMNWFNRR